MASVFIDPIVTPLVLQSLKDMAEEKKKTHPNDYPTSRPYVQWTKFLKPNFKKTLDAYHNPKRALNKLDALLRLKQTLTHQAEVLNWVDDLALEHFAQILKHMEPFLASNSLVCSRNVTDPIVDVLTFLMFAFWAQHQQALGLPPFLFNQYKASEADHESNTMSVFQSFVMSRQYYILNGVYLPIVLQVRFYAHVTYCLYLPSETHPHIWYRIFIDTSGVTQDRDDSYFNHYREFEDTERTVNLMFQSYLVTQYDADRSTVEFVTIPCIEDIQKAYDTCSHWSNLLALFFLIHWKYVSQKSDREPTFVTQWCFQLSQLSSQHMHRFVDMFITVRKTLYTYIYQTAVNFLWNIHDRSVSVKSTLARGIVYRRPRVTLWTHLTYKFPDDSVMLTFINTVLMGFSSSAGYTTTHEQDLESRRTLDALIQVIRAEINSIDLDISSILKLKQSPSPSLLEQKTMSPQSPPPSPPSPSSLIRPPTPDESEDAEHRPEKDDKDDEEDEDDEDQLKLELEHRRRKQQRSVGLDVKARPEKRKKS